MLNRVISASFLLVASANADGLLSSSLGLGDPKTIEQKDLQERVLTGAEIMLFNTCKGRKEIDCKRIINRAHRIAPGKFGGSTRVYFKKERVRDDFNWDKYHPDDLLLYPDYWLIGIRTSLDGTYVAGFDDAGKVEYKYPWCVADDTPGKGYSCHGLGPWTCSGGMTFTECCDYAKADVASRGLLVADLHGNYLECYDSPPPEADPLDYGRVKLHVDRGNVVVHTPRNG